MREEKTAAYIAVLLDALKKKSSVLDELRASALEQSNILDQDTVDIDSFENTVESKDKMLKELERLDMGFESVYQRASDELKENKELHKQEIKAMQELIRRIAACSADIGVLEERNKKKFQQYISNQRNRIKVSVKNSQTANAYYKNMADQHQDGQSYFLDKKK